MNKLSTKKKCMDRGITPDDSPFTFHATSTRDRRILNVTEISLCSADLKCRVSKFVGPVSKTEHEG